MRRRGPYPGRPILLTGPSRHPRRFESPRSCPPGSGSKTKSLSLRRGSYSGRFKSTFFPLFDVYTLNQKPQGN